MGYKVMSRWKVLTQWGAYETVAVSAKKAISNIRYRLRAHNYDTWSWTAIALD